jgi:hypothetical protein
MLSQLARIGNKRTQPYHGENPVSHYTLNANEIFVVIHEENIDGALKTMRYSGF